jgi:hypothetical protein
MKFHHYLSAIILVSVVGFWGCEKVQKPELRGQGPLAITVERGTATPEYHAPLESWRNLHMEAINRGDFTQKECVLCHNPQTGCNRCHGYVGAKEVNIPEAELYYAGTKK